MTPPLTPIVAGLVLCPSCKGQCRTFAFINTGPDSSKHRSGYIDCHTCKGKGNITTEHYAMIEEGKRRRQERVSKGESLFDAAKRLGITPAALSAIECGRAAADAGKVKQNNGEEA